MNNTDNKQEIAYEACLTRYGVSLRFNRGRIQKAEVVDKDLFNSKGVKLSRVLNKFDRYLR